MSKLGQSKVTSQREKPVVVTGDAFDQSHKVELALIAQYVHVAAQRAALRLRKTKNRGEVRGGGAKPWRQKGSGRARHGSRRSPIWVGGGHTHALIGAGPKRVRMPRRMRVAAVKSAIAARMGEKAVVFIDKFTLAEPKTRFAAAALKKAVPSGRTILLVLPGKDRQIERAVTNLSKVSVIEARLLNAKEIITYDVLVFVGDAPKVLMSTMS